MGESFRFSRYASLVGVACVYLFLYVPIFFLVLYSFNESPVWYRWEGFSLTWYRALLETTEIWHALKNSLIVAVSTVVLSLSMSILFVFYGARMGWRSYLPVFWVNLMIPEIAVAGGLLSFFVFFSVPLGLPTLIIGHTLIGLGYAIPIISARYDDIDYRLTEASYDLGASRYYTLMKVIIPLLMPAIVASALLIFVLSLDDFLIAFFCSGPSSQTLSLYIFSMLRSGVSPMVNALSSIILLVSTMLVIVYSFLQIRMEEP